VIVARPVASVPLFIRDDDAAPALALGHASRIPP
jgi:hypothetical protein